MFIELGIYEEGMPYSEMTDIFNTIKISEKSASDEQEYRDTLNKSNQICEEVLSVINNGKDSSGKSFQLKGNLSIHVPINQNLY